MQLTVPSSLSIRDLIIELIVELVKMCDAHKVKLSSRDTCMYMKPSTILFLFSNVASRVNISNYVRILTWSMRNLNILQPFYVKIVTPIIMMLQTFYIKFMIRIQL